MTALALLGVGCGDDGGTTTSGPDAAEVEAAVAERHGADAEQAACIRGYLVVDYEPDELQAVVDDGLAGLPQARWEPYLGAVVTCLTLEPSER